MRTIDVVVPAYNATGAIRGLIAALKSQRLDKHAELSIFIVDDGSDDQGAVATATGGDSGVTLVRHTENRGRAAARNSGARAGRGALIVFLDADCLIEDSTFIMRHVRAIEGGADASAGICIAKGGGFLAALAADINVRRASAPPWTAFTSANFAVRRDIFDACGGFDERYRRYGFEDRDFAARLTKRGYRLALTPKAVAFHLGIPAPEALLRRFEEAGEFTSSLFLRDHPEHYAELPYSHFDFRLYPYRGRVLYCAGVALSPLLRALAARVVSRNSSAFALKALALRAAAALAYLSGTRRAWRRERH